MQPWPPVPMVATEVVHEARLIAGISDASAPPRPYKTWDTGTTGPSHRRLKPEASACPGQGSRRRNWACQQVLGTTGVFRGRGNPSPRRGSACRCGARQSRRRRGATAGPGMWDAGGSPTARRKQRCSSPEQGSRGCSIPRCSPVTEADGLGESHRQPGLPVWHPACPAGRRAGLHCLLLLCIGSPGLMMRLLHYKRRVLYLQGGSQKSGM